jgi:hypothetical protein
MQTFLPYADFQKSAESLDYKRLGKQRVEAYQILKALSFRKSEPTTKRGWVTHPCTEMWIGYEYALTEYALTMCKNWILRGYKDTISDKIYSFQKEAQNRNFPIWLGDEELHLSHRSRLAQKYPEYYLPQFPDADLQMEYKWVKSPFWS